MTTVTIYVSDIIYVITEIYCNIARCCSFSRKSDNVLLITVDVETANSALPSVNGYTANQFQI